MSNNTPALQHHGILGMRWGIRRDRGRGGTVSETAAGQAGLQRRKQQKQQTGEPISPSARRLGNADAASNDQPQQGSDYAEARAMRKRGVENLSTKELEKLTKRIDLEKRYKKLGTREQGAVEKLITELGRETAKNLASHVLTSYGKKLLDAKIGPAADGLIERIKG